MNEQTVHAAFETLTIPTYETGTPNTVPLFFENRGYQGACGKVFPLPYTENLSDTPLGKDYKAGVLENEYIRVETLPALGGKINRALDKTTGYDFIYHNPVIKPAMIGLCGPWVSGGIEFNWPQHHRPTTMMPVEATIEESADGQKTVWMGECEPFNRSKAMVGVTVCPGKSYIKAKVRIYNRTPVPQPFMWWANLAVNINDGYRVTFPSDVEYVCDHDRRAVSGWPNPQGVFKTARPFDYKPGDNLEEIPTVKVPSSFMVPKGQTDHDFVSGYDTGVGCGLVTVANHHVSPGKKLFHWGVHQFGKNWCSNLTDDGSCYVELMTGVYTDNQPDFTFIAPYETKEFEQYWYPIAAIGQIKNASIDAAINIEPRDGKLFVGAQTTGVYPGCKLTALDADKVVYEKTVDLSPDKPFVEQTDVAVGKDKLSATLTDAEGRKLVDLVPFERGHKKAPEPRQPAPKPETIGSNEELFLHGKHLEQYKHFSLDPADYYLEAIKRDPGDLRCNAEMAKLRYNKGLFEEALAFADKSIERLTMRNDNAFDAEVYYTKGLILCKLGREKEAYDSFYRCVWNYAQASAGYFQLAQLDCKHGEWETALGHLELSLSTNQKFIGAWMLKAAVLRRLHRSAEAAAVVAKVRVADPLDFRARFEAAADLSMFAGKVDCYVDAAREYVDAGLYDEAFAVMGAADQSAAKTQYNLGWLYKLTGDDVKAAACYAKAEATYSPFEFFNRLGDIAMLADAKAASPLAAYQLGNLYYDRFRYDDAIAEWEFAMAKLPDFAAVRRNLGKAFEDKRGDLAGARMLLEKALELEPDNDRFFDELRECCHRLNLPREARLALHNAHPVLSARRDECVRDQATLEALGGDYDAAIATLASHSFHTYEGGEGALTQLHAWIHMLKAQAQYDEGKFAEAKETFEAGLRMPQQYHEVKSYFTQDSHLYFGIARCCEALGDAEGAKEALGKAVVNYGMLSPTTYYYALALRRLGRHSEAQDLLKRLVKQGEEMLGDGGSYFSIGVSYGGAKQNVVAGNTLLIFGLAGLGRMQEAKARADELKAVDGTNFNVHLFEQLI